MTVVIISLMTIILIAIIGVTTYLAVDYNKHKKENETDFEEEKQARLKNIKTVVTQVNTANKQIDDYNKNQFRKLNTNITRVDNSIENTKKDTTNKITNLNTQLATTKTDIQKQIGITKTDIQKQIDALNNKLTTRANTVDSVIKIKESFQNPPAPAAKPPAPVAKPPAPAAKPPAPVAKPPAPVAKPPAPAAKPPVAKAPVPLKKRDIDVMAQVNALGGVTIKDLDTNKPFKICGKTGRCISIPGGEGNTYLTNIVDGKAIRLDAPIEAKSSMKFYQKAGKDGKQNNSPYAELNPTMKAAFAENVFAHNILARDTIAATKLSFSPVIVGEKALINDLQIGAKTAKAKGNAYITQSGDSKVNTLTLGNKFRFSGVGDAHGNDDWLRMFDPAGKGYKGGIAMGKLWVGGEASLNGKTNMNTANISNNLNLKGGTSVENSNKWGTHFPWSGDNKNYIRGDTEIRGTTNQLGDINVHKKIRFLDPANNGGSDPYYIEKIATRPNQSTLRLTINDDSDESFEIWGDSCKTTGCGGPGVMRHKFGASGDATHTGALRAGQLCINNTCLTEQDIKNIKQTSGTEINANRINIGKRWSIGPEQSNEILVVRDKLTGGDKRLAVFPGVFTDIQAPTTTTTAAKS